MTIRIKLFGVPHVERGGERIFFPYNKINAMIYYLAVNETIPRTEIAGLLWPDEEEAIAKKNLRNAIYQAKRCIGEDFILSPKKLLLELNRSLDVVCDATCFAEDPVTNLALYDGPFLQGFYVKDSEQYDFWVTRMRSFYEEKYIAHAYQQLEKQIEEGQNENVEKSIHTLISMDEYDERSVRLLMRYYAKTGRTGKVIETYYNLKKLLRDELGVSPDVETRTIYEEAVNQIEITDRQSKAHEEFFYGRFQERALLQKNLQLLPAHQAISQLVKGEAGIGKSALLRKTLEEAGEEAVLLQAYCYCAEQEYALRPFAVLIERMGEALKRLGISLPTYWDSTMKQLFPPLESATKELFFPEVSKGLNFDLLSQIFLEGIRKISAEHPLIIVLEDIQWMDEVSVRLLTSVMLRMEKRAMFLFTARPEMSQALEDALATLTGYGLVETIALERFDREQSFAFIKEALKKPISSTIMEKIYHETEGNPFFLTEFVQLLTTSETDSLMTEKMKDALRARFAYLSKPERDVLDLVSFFYDEAPLSVLMNLMGRSDSDIIGLIEHLEHINILTERAHESDIGIRFTHVKLREYIYMMQPHSKCRVIHKRIAQILEDSLQIKPSLYLYSKLVYHYTSADEPLKSIQFELEMLNYYLNFSHELFPILSIQEADEGEKAYISRDRLQDMFATLEEKFNTLRTSTAGEDLIRLEMQFYYMKGRYLIRDGAYAEGLKDMREAVGKAKTLNDKDYELEAYKQFIFYNIQTNQAEEMLSYIEGALHLAVQCNYHKEIGILLRLKGLYNIMTGHHTMAEQLLNESIQTFTVTPEVARRYAINIAAAHNYIGEIRFHEAHYEEALQEFEEAITLSQDKNALSAMSVFYINKGKSLFALGRRQEAKEEFTRAYPLYGKFDSFWKRPVLDAYMALIAWEGQEKENAVTYLHQALDCSQKMNDPRAQGTAYYAAYRLLKETENTPEATLFATVCERPKEEYLHEALLLLDPHRDHFERAYLQESEA